MVLQNRPCPQNKEFYDLTEENFWKIEFFYSRNEYVQKIITENNIYLEIYYDSASGPYTFRFLISMTNRL